MAAPIDVTPAAGRAARERPVHLQLLQHPRLVVAGRAPQALAPKDAALLGLLAVEAATARATVASWLWPHTATAQARTNLRQRLLRLKRVAGRPVVVGEHTLTLAPCITHDLQDGAQALRADPHALTGELLGLLDFPDCEELAHWLQRARSQWRARCHDVLAARAMELQQAGRPEQALPYLQRLVSEEPLHEAYHRHLMHLHHRRGDRSAALAVYQGLQALLRSELGVEPNLETRLLSERIKEDCLHHAAGVAPRTARRREVFFIGQPGVAFGGWLHAAAELPPRAVVIQLPAQPVQPPYGVLRRLLQSLLALPGAEAVRRQMPAPLQALLQPAAGLTLPIDGLHAAIDEVLDHTRPACIAIDGVEHADPASMDALAVLVSRRHGFDGHRDTSPT